jgi:translation initiation factor 4B
LNLQKRTVSEADPNQSPRTADSKSSPFGAARPIDTSAREKEVEERRQLAIRQKKEAEEKTKAEKAEKQKLAKEQAKEKAEKAEGADSKTQENGSDVPQSGKNFEILRRAADDQNGMAADIEAEDEAGEDVASKEKAEAPSHAARELPPSKANGKWRNEGSQKPVGPAAPKAEDDGWSTVSTKQRNNRRGNQNTRAS